MVRVAAYCRVSTEKEDQLNSLVSQKRYFHDYIERNPLWELKEIYADEGITGTSTRKRHAFGRMLNDAQQHKFELILTKEISRFARNTLDSIYYTRQLKDLGIGIIFLNDNINTLDSDAELRLTILASIAQEESRKTSDRVKWGQKRSMERGVVFGRDMLGYDLRDGRLYLNEEGAETVRLIFYKFVKEGKGTQVIARELEQAGIPAGRGRNKWHGSVVLRILKNEKYCGDLIQKKTYTPDYLKHEKRYNKGEEEFICICDHHEPVVSRELFHEAQEEIRRRSPSPDEKKKYSNRYCLSGLIRCGTCGSSYVSRTRKRKDGSVSRYWRCYEAVQNGRLHIDETGCKSGCGSPTMKEEDLKFILQDLMRNLKIDKQRMINNLAGILKQTAGDETLCNELHKLRNRLTLYSLKKQKLIDLYLSEEISETDFKMIKQKYETEMKQLTKACEELSYIGGCNGSRGENDGGIEFLRKLINGQEWNDIFYHNLVDKIIVKGCLPTGDEVNHKDKKGFYDRMAAGDNCVSSAEKMISGKNRSPANSEITIYLKNTDIKIHYNQIKED